jgi:hypothetical protein
VKSTKGESIDAHEGEPPVSLLVELKMAELFVKLESTDTIKFKPRVLFKV